MAGERQPYLSKEREKACSVGTTFLTPRTIDAIVALSLPVARSFLSEIELGYGKGDAVKRVIEGIIDAFPERGRPIVNLVGLDEQVEILRYAVKRAESISRIELLGGDACCLPFLDGARDFALAAGLLTQNIKNNNVQTIIREAVRVAQIVAICDFEILDPRKRHQQEVIDLKRLGAYQKRYKVTAEALEVPFGTIISTILPDSNLVLERKLRELELRGDAESLSRIYYENQEELRLSRHFETEVLEEWLSSSGAQIAYSEVGVPYLSPSGNPLSGLILIGYSPTEL